MRPLGLVSVFPTVKKTYFLWESSPEFFDEFLEMRFVERVVVRNVESVSELLGAAVGFVSVSKSNEAISVAILVQS